MSAQPCNTSMCVPLQNARSHDLLLQTDAGISTVSPTSRVMTWLSCTRPQHHLGTGFERRPRHVQSLAAVLRGCDASRKRNLEARQGCLLREHPSLTLEAWAPRLAPLSTVSLMPPATPLIAFDAAADASGPGRIAELSLQGPACGTYILRG